MFNSKRNQNSIKFDLFGQRRLSFDSNSVTYRAKELYPIPFLGVVLSSTSSSTIPFDDVSWIGIIKKRQWWALLTSLFGLSLGIPWLVIYFGDWGVFAGCVGFVALLGLLPLRIFWRGRPFLAIVSDVGCISFPADRKKKQVRRAVASLRESCPHAEFNGVA